jgi:hypothetical protein
MVLMEEDTPPKEVLKRIRDTPTSYRKMEKKFKVLNLVSTSNSPDPHIPLP